MTSELVLNEGDVLNVDRTAVDGAKGRYLVTRKTPGSDGLVTYDCLSDPENHSSRDSDRL